MPIVVAHQGGWDEILMVLLPIALFAGLLVIANRRAESIERGRASPPGESGESGDTDGEGEGDVDDAGRTDGAGDEEATDEAGTQ